MSCFLLSPPSRKIIVVSLGKASIIRYLSSRSGRVIPAALGGGMTTLGMAARSPFRCRFQAQAGAVVILTNFLFFSS
jgi:hypothetical protein